MTALHKNLPTGEIHIPYSWEYDNATQRLAATGFVTADLGKLAWQHDDNTIWLLSAIAPTWIQVGGTAPGSDAADIYLEVRKGTSGTINIGQPVCQTGYNVGGWLEVELADADDPTRMPCIGLAKDIISTTDSKKVVVSGRISGFNTSAFSNSPPDLLYVSTTAGVLTKTKPTGASTKIQRIASVVYSHATQGIVSVFGSNRINDLPNLTLDKGWRGDSNGQPVEVLMVYGDEYDYQAQEARTTVTGTTWTTRVTIYVPAGVGRSYEIKFSCKIDANNKSCGVRLYNVTDAAVLDYSVITPSGASLLYNISSFVKVDAGAVQKQIDLQWHSEGAAGDVIGIQQARVSRIRVS